MPLATKVDGCVGDTNIAEMWKCQYKSLLNSVENKNCKKSVMLDIDKQIKNSTTITPFNILDALKNIKCGKSSGIVAFPQSTLYLLIVAFMCYYHY